MLRGGTLQDSGRSSQVFGSASVGELVGDEGAVDGAGKGMELGSTDIVGPTEGRDEGCKEALGL